MKKMSGALILILIVLMFQNMLRADEKINMAVLTLNSRGGLSESEVGILTDRLRSMLVRTQAFDVVDRGRMSEILDEQGFQMTGCTSAECAVEAGKILGVEQMVSGSIGRIGKMYTIDIVLIDISTSRIVNSPMRDHSGKIEGLVDQMKSIADELAAQYQKTEQTGSIKIESKPAGAKIFLDGNEVGITPKTIENLSAGQHSLKLTKNGYAITIEEFQIAADKINSFFGMLKPAFNLVINSTPPDARVFVDNELIGVSPVKYAVEERRKIMVVVKRTGYKTWQQNITMDKNQLFEVNLQPGSGLATTEYEKTEEGGSSTIWWVLGGSAVIGGGVAYLLTQPSADKPEAGTMATTLPNPPARPQ